MKEDKNISWEVFFPKFQVQKVISQNFYGWVDVDFSVVIIDVAVVDVAAVFAVFIVITVTIGSAIVLLPPSLLW